MIDTGVIWTRTLRPEYAAPVPAAAAPKHTTTSSLKPGAVANANIFLSSKDWRIGDPGGSAFSLSGESNLSIL
jgi:hypothetical protein